MSGVRTDNYDVVRLLTLQAASVLDHLIAERDASVGPKKTGLRKLVIKAEQAYKACLETEEFMNGEN